VVEHEGGRQAQAGERLQAVAQLDRGHRVEPQVLEGPVGVDGRGALVAEDGGDLLPQHVDE